MAAIKIQREIVAQVDTDISGVLFDPKYSQVKHMYPSNERPNLHRLPATIYFLKNVVDLFDLI